jgi:hypothetical protein
MHSRVEVGSYHMLILSSFYQWSPTLVRNTKLLHHDVLPIENSHIHFVARFLRRNFFFKNEKKFQV